MLIVYGGLLLKAYGTRMDAQRCANSIKSLKQVFSVRKESKTTTLTKPKLCSHVLICSAVIKDLLCSLQEETLSLHYAIAFSVLDIGVMYLWPWV